MDNAQKSPEYLRSLESLQQHFRAQLEGLTTADKGDRFTHFVQRLIPQTALGAEYDFPVLSKNKSVDQGVDLTAENRTDAYACLYVQSRMWIDRADAIDSVMSKFQAYVKTTPDTGQTIIIDLSYAKAHFLLVTLSPISGILHRYESTPFASRAFYLQCKSENRIHFIDGHDILQGLKAAYNKLSSLKTNLVLNLAAPCVTVANVHVGIISCQEIRSLYKTFGDALFFENVRDFLGIPPRGTERFGRTTPNNEIVKTLTKEPEKLLSRNNGLVFGAEKVEIADNSKVLTLINGSVVNGCQTTMCIVDTPGEQGYVLVKVVETKDGWDITRAANYQNLVPDIDLELAKYSRAPVGEACGGELGGGNNGC